MRDEPGLRRELARWHPDRRSVLGLSDALVDRRRKTVDANFENVASLHGDMLAQRINRGEERLAFDDTILPRGQASYRKTELGHLVASAFVPGFSTPTGSCGCTP